MSYILLCGTSPDSNDSDNEVTTENRDCRSTFLVYADLRESFNWQVQRVVVKKTNEKKRYIIIMLGNMLYVIFTIIVQMCSARLCNECHVTYVPAFDDIVLSDNQLWSRVAPSREVCYRLCFMDQKCVTFQHNSVSEICRGHDGSFTSQVISQGTADTGNKLYMTCRGDSHLGFGCKSDSDCRSLLNECIDGVCQCSSGFDYNNKTLSCGYHGCFRDDSSRLLPHELTHSDIMTNKFCIDHCLAAGYRLSGTEVGKQCFCGNTIPTSYEMYSESRCSSSCSGDTTKRCGGVWAISIYSTGV